MKKKFEILMVACLFISAFLLARASAALTSSRHAASSKTWVKLIVFVLMPDMEEAILEKLAVTMLWKKTSTCLLC